MEDTDVSWGHQVAVMFQIVSALALEVPAFLQNTDVQLSCEPWGHVDHSGGGCECLSSDSTGAYVHGLSLMPRDCVPVSEMEDVLVFTGGSGARTSHVSRREAPGLLAVYVWWKMGLLVTSDWLRPVMRGGGGWRAGPPVTVYGAADVSCHLTAGA